MLYLSWVEVRFVNENQPTWSSQSASNECFENSLVVDNIFSHCIRRSDLRLSPGVSEILSHEFSNLPGVNFEILIFLMSHDLISNDVQSYVLTFQLLECLFDCLNF